MDEHALTRSEDRAARRAQAGRANGQLPRLVVAHLCVVAIVGLLATGGLMAWALRPHGVYWSEAKMRFVSPTYPSIPNSLQTSGVSLIMVAGAVGQMIDDSRQPPTASDQVTIADRGIRSGWSVKLLNAGGQWSTYYTDPVLDVQAAGSTAEAVVSTMRMLTRTVSADLLALQQKAGVSAPNMINARQLNDASPQIYYEAGSRSRALASSLLVGVGFTLTVMWVVSAHARRSHYGATGVPSV